MGGLMGIGHFHRSIRIINLIELNSGRLTGIPSLPSSRPYGHNPANQ
jgi:hypothetical protein